MKTLVNIISFMLMCFGIGAIFLGLIIVVSFIFEHLWNVTMPFIFELPPVSFNVSVAIVAFIVLIKTIIS